MSQKPNFGPWVTIAIPTYNRAATFLPAALESALRQSYPRVEVLVSDNASNDGTEALVQRFADPRLRYIRHPSNIGANGNFNSCLSHAKGDYFLLLHDDDCVDEDFVATCIEAANYRSNFALIRTGVRVIEEHGRLVRSHRNHAADLGLSDYFVAWFKGRTCWYLVNTLFHTERLRALGGLHSPHELVEDGFAIARLAAAGPRLDIAAVKSSFRVHGGEQTFAQAGNAVAWGEDYLDLLDCMCALVSADEAERVRSLGLKFFSRLAYNRAAAIQDPVARWREYVAVCRLFQYRYFPTHRIAGRRFALRARDYARRRVLHSRVLRIVSSQLTR